MYAAFRSDNYRLSCNDTRDDTALLKFIRLDNDKVIADLETIAPKKR